MADIDGIHKRSPFDFWFKHFTQKVVSWFFRSSFDWLTGRWCFIYQENVV